jgi:hypothetical protein
MSIFSTHPSSASLQKDYVKLRKSELFPNDERKNAAVRKVIESLQVQHRLRQEDWLETYKTLCTWLQRSELTINLEARNWFLNKNDYKHYDQTYQRAVGADGVMRLKDTEVNTAATRAMVDDLVTIPEEWANALPDSKRRRVMAAMTVTGAKKPPKNDHPDARMHPQLQGDGAGAGMTTTNAAFKPKAKQVFAALNYGQRRHGSNTLYGHSYLVLKPKLKQDAFFYPGDTFHAATQGTRAQATFYTLGAIVEHAPPQLLEALCNTVFHRQPQDITDKAALLVECHIFKRLKVAEHVDKLLLCRHTKKGDISESDWALIQTNARKWCRRNGVQFDIIT